MPAASQRIIAKVSGRQPWVSWPYSTAGAPLQQLVHSSYMQQRLAGNPRARLSWVGLARISTAVTGTLAQQRRHTVRVGA